MDRILLLVTVTIIATTAAKAQSVTYNHDSPKQNRYGSTLARPLLLHTAQQV